MGYFEHTCQFCGVSFAIARFRRDGEPPAAAWNDLGTDFVDQHDVDDCGQDRVKDTGCYEVERPLSWTVERLGREHIAGPGCCSSHGYSGCRISLEEMRGCRAVQCLAPKPADWEPEPDDEDFELEADCFLTGIGDGSPYVDALENLVPVRHKVDNLWISNWRDAEIVDMEGFGMPFHPTCFEIFKKVSTRQLGKVDVQSLWRWYLLEAKVEDMFSRFGLDDDVKSGREQWWNHEPGKEYLVGNPIEVPSLADLLKDCSRTTDEDGVFNPPEQGPVARNSNPRDGRPRGLLTTSDPFLTLPPELTRMILFDCSTKDIAHLRLVSRAFQQLDHLVIRRRLLEDFVWFWEARDLPVKETDWLKLYREAKSCFAGLKGLRNRKRIWKHAEELVRRIDGLAQEENRSKFPPYLWRMDTNYSMRRC